MFTIRLVYLSCDKGVVDGFYRYNEYYLDWGSFVFLVAPLANYLYRRLIMEDWHDNLVRRLLKMLKENYYVGFI